MRSGTNPPVVKTKLPLSRPWLYCIGTFSIGLLVGLLLAWNIVITVQEYRLIPTEIVIKPPPVNTSWCFPNTSLRGAEKVQQLLRGRLHVGKRAVQADSQTVADAVRISNLNDPPYHLWVLGSLGEHYTILSQGAYELTLATEKGNFYLMRIPTRFDAKYDSLVDVRFGAE